jgi:WD40 repeat protein
LHGWRLPDGANIEMRGYPGQPRSLSFSADGRFLATSGGMRAVCWRFDPPDADDEPHECGITGKTPVSRVACHPAHPLIAVGYHSGAVLLCQPGSSDILFIKGSGNSAVSAMAWSPDGGRLALGTEAGELALVFLPEELFRFGRRR